MTPRKRVTATVGTTDGPAAVIAQVGTYPGGDSWVDVPQAEVRIRSAAPDVVVLDIMSDGSLQAHGGGPVPDGVAMWAYDTPEPEWP